MISYPIVLAISLAVPTSILVLLVVLRQVFIGPDGHIPHAEAEVADKPSGDIKGVFKNLDALLAAIEAAKKAGFNDFTVLSPLPRHEIEEAIYEGRPSPVRWWTMIGGICGGTGGFTLASLTSAVWPMTLPGGKPVVSVPPFVIIVFECTVLIGGLITLAAIIYHCRLPAFDLSIECCDPRFSNDRFGMVIHGAQSKKSKELVTKLLHDAGADEIAAPTDEVSHGG